MKRMKKDKPVLGERGPGRTGFASWGSKSVAEKKKR